MEQNTENSLEEIDERDNRKNGGTNETQTKILNIRQCCVKIERNAYIESKIKTMMKTYGLNAQINSSNTNMTEPSTSKVHYHENIKKNFYNIEQSREKKKINSKIPCIR